MSSLFDVSGKIVCVTGASGGIGRHIAKYLSDQGAKIVGVARREDSLKTWVSECANDAQYVVADLNEQDKIDEIADEVRMHFGAPDILISAAGINTREIASDVTREGWNITLNLNLSTPFFLAQCFAPDMIKSGWGRIINFASLQSYRAFPGGMAYGTSKGGVVQMTRAMAEAWSSQGVTANAIGPGFFKTELTEAVFADPARAKRNAEQTCIGRNGHIEDLEGPIQFLCSRASDYVTGQVLMVDGGFTAK